MVMDGAQTVFVYSRGPGQALDGGTILIVCGEELQVLVWLTRSAAAATFDEERGSQAWILENGGR